MAKRTKKPYRPKKQVPLSAVFVKADVEWSVVTDENIDAVVAEALKHRVIASDFETTGLEYKRGIKAVGLAWCWEENHAWYFPLDHLYPNAHEFPIPTTPKTKRPKWEWEEPVPVTEYRNLDPEKARAAIARVHSNPSILIVGSNVKFDCWVSQEILGVVVANPFDIGSLARVTRDFMKVGLKELMDNELDRWPFEEDSLYGSLKALGLKKHIDNDKLPVPAMAVYNAADVIFTLRLFFRLLKDIRYPNEWAILRLEQQLIPTLMHMEGHGIPVDTDYFRKVQGDLLQEQEDLVREAGRIAGRPINPGSSEQIQAFLFDPKKDGGLELKPTKMTSGGANNEPKPSVDEEALEILKRKTEEQAEKIGDARGEDPEYPDWLPLIDIVLRYRTADKFRGTYCQNLIEAAEDFGGHQIYTSIKSEAARSGRLAASIMMTIPKRKDPTIIRGGFVANLPWEDEWDLLEGDADQVEFRLFAHWSKDPNLIQRITEGQDFHTAVTSILFGVPPEEVTKEQRNIGKTCNFALLYGAGIRRIAAELNKSFKEAKELVGQYHERIPAVRRLQKEVANMIRSVGFVATHFGLIRRFPKFMAYAALDHIIQGTATGCLKLGLVEANQVLRDKGFRSHILLPIHDSFYVRRHRSESLFDLIAILNDALTRFEFRVPLTASFEISSTNWAEMEEIDVQGLWLKPTWEATDRNVDRILQPYGQTQESLGQWGLQHRPQIAQGIGNLQDRIQKDIMYRHHMTQWRTTLKAYERSWEILLREQRMAA
jgi:DNA polymerase-1